MSELADTLRMVWVYWLARSLSFRQDHTSGEEGGRLSHCVHLCDCRPGSIVRVPDRGLSSVQKEQLLGKCP
jgi:hypothetical protein